MPAPRRFAMFALVIAAIAPSPSWAWNPAGHRVISTIAYRQLDEPTRNRVAEVLRKHPANAKLWTDRFGNGPDPVLNLFWNASLFPDDARRPPWDKYNRPRAHYVNFRIMADQGNQVEPPLGGED